MLLLSLISVELGALKKRNSASSCRCAILRSTLKEKKCLKKFQFYLKGGRKGIPGQQLLVRDPMGGLPRAPSCPQPRAARKSSCGGIAPCSWRMPLARCLQWGHLADQAGAGARSLWYQPPLGLSPGPTPLPAQHPVVRGCGYTVGTQNCLTWLEEGHEDRRCFWLGGEGDVTFDLKLMLSRLCKG